MKVLNLSGIDGVADYHLPAKLKDAMCLVKTDSGHIELRVSGHLINSAEVMDYERQLKKTNTEFKLVSSNIAEIVELYQQSGVTTQEQLNIIHGKIFEIFSAATDARSSDIHFRLHSKLCNVFFRVDGKLRFYKELTPEEGKSYINSLFNTRCEDRSHQSISYQEPCGAKVSEDFVQPLGLSGGRFASRPVADGGMVAVIRLISRRNEILSMEQLGLTDTEIDTLERAIAKPTGVIFLTGPMGSGKSTLAQVVCELLTSRDPGIHLLTVENPVESPIKGAVQTSLGTGEEWWQAIKSMMRLDLNWILIGEVRDPLSASAAIEAAQTGHNVLTTIHTTFPIDTISRLKSLNVQSDLITDASLITCLVGQRLAPKLCPSCKQKYTDSSKSVAPVIKKIIDKHGDIDSIYLKNPQGCAECSGAGVKGRVGIFEVIEVDANFMDIYHSQGKIKAYEHWYINGGATLCTNTLRLINNGEIDPVLSHKDVCNLDRDYLIFTDEVRAAAKMNREKIIE